MGLAVVAGLSGSSAVLALTVHSWMAASSFALGLWGRASGAPRPVVERRFWTAVAPILLYSFGGGIVVMEGTQRMMVHRGMGETGIVYGALTGAGVVLGLALLVLVRNPEDTSRGGDGGDLVRFQSVAVLAGVGVASAGVLGADRAGWTSADGGACVLIGLVMATVAAYFALDVRRTLQDGDQLRDRKMAPLPAVGVPAGIEITGLETKSLGAGGPDSVPDVQPAPRPAQAGAAKPTVVARGQGKKGRGARR